MRDERLVGEGMVGDGRLVGEGMAGDECCVAPEADRDIRVVLRDCIQMLVVTGINKEMLSA